MSVAIRYFGGPKDGETELREDAPWQLVCPWPTETAYYSPFALANPLVEPNTRNAYYQRTGPVVGGVADYTCIEV